VSSEVKRLLVSQSRSFRQKDRGTGHAWCHIDGIDFDVTAFINKIVHKSHHTRDTYDGEEVSRDALIKRHIKRDAAARAYGEALAAHVKSIGGEAVKEQLEKVKDKLIATSHPARADENREIFHTAIGFTLPDDPDGDDSHFSQGYVMEKWGRAAVAAAA
jgi:hypothetical protein